MCTLKGMCQYTFFLFDVGGVEIHSIHSIECCTKDQSNVKDVKDTLYRFKCIKCYVMLCMSKTSKMVFAAFMQHCIQSNVNHVTGVKGVQGVKRLCNVLCIQRPLAPPRGKVIWKAFHLVGLVVHHQSVQGGSFINFLGLVNYKGDCRQEAQPIPNS